MGGFCYNNALMQTSWTPFSLFGIPIRINLSVGLLALYLIYSFNSLGTGAFMAVALVASILLHELAHSGVAIAFGGRVHDITLQVLGGCARIVRMPPKAWQELLMALAGPACSLALAVLFGVLAYALGTETSLGYNPIAGEYVIYVEPNLWFTYAAGLNFGLGMFNLIPAFPMDGGRVLRSGLQAAGQSKAQATEVAVLVGRGFAVLWAALFALDVLFGIQLKCPEGAPLFVRLLWSFVFQSSSVLLVLIAYMIWVTGRRELEYVRMESRFRGGWQ